MPSKDRFKLDRTFTYRLHALHKLSDKQSNQAYVDEAGLSLSEGRSLAAVGAFEPLSVVELARRANLDKGQASRAAQALVDRGFVTKEAHESDGRGVLLALSPSGRAAWKRLSALIERRNAEIFGCLSDKELRLLDGMLDRIIERL